MKRHHVGISVTADRHSDAVIRQRILPGLSVGGRPLSVAEFRAYCVTARIKGYQVLPPCDNVDEQGFCKGHPAPEPGPGPKTCRECSECEGYHHRVEGSTKCKHCPAVLPRLQDEE